MLNLKVETQFLLELPPVYTGPCSRVYRAQDLSLGRTVGVKEVDLRQLSRQERRTLGSEVNVWCDYACRTAKMPQIYARFQAGETLYIVMQWIEGHTLRALLEEGNLTFGQKMSFAIQLCDALAPLHAARRQHRDIKPENIQISRRDQLYLIDFNISSAVPHQGVGTDGYLAPECSGLSRQPGAGRVDVFAIGVILYELFTGEMPIFGLDYAAEPQDTAWQLFVMPSEKNPQIRPELDRIIARCMALQWKDRYDGAGAIGRDLRKLQHNRNDQNHPRRTR